MKKLIDDDGRPYYGVHSDPFDILNISDFKPHGKKLSSLKKILTHKRWLFLGAANRELIFGIAVVKLGYLSNVFAYVFDRQERKITEFDLKQPFAAGTIIHGTGKEGKISFAKGKTSVHIGITGKEVLLKAQIKKRMTVELAYTRGKSPLNVVTKSGTKGFNYTEKEAGMAVEGSVKLDGREYLIQNAEPCGIMDYTCGALERRTNWNWASGAGADIRGRKVAFNFSQGINETGHTENAFWIDGVMKKVGTVDFRYDEKNYLSEWLIISDDKKVKFSFRPEGERAMDFNIGLIKSFYHQPFGTFSGELSDGNEIYVIDEAFGVTEDHEAIW